MYENEINEFDLDDITDFLKDKISGLTGDSDDESLDDILSGEENAETVDDIKSKMSDKKVDTLSQKEKMEIYSKASSDDDFYSAILFGIGAPQSQKNIDFLKFWRIAEMGTNKNNKKRTATNNPLNTMYNHKMDSDMYNFNSVGVKNYSKPEYGIDATVKTLKNGFYNCIVDSLRKQKDHKEIAACVSPADNKTIEMNTWGTGDKHLISVIDMYKSPNDARKIDRDLPK